MKKTGISNVLTATVSMLFVLMAMHYWFSYWYIYKMIALFDITPNPIISMEDVTFSYGKQNFLMLLLLFSYIAAILLPHLFGDDLAKLMKKIKPLSLAKTIKNKIVVGFLIIVVVPAFLAIIYSIYYLISNIVIKYMGVSIITILIIAGIIGYYVAPKKRKILFLTLIGLAFMWGTTFISAVFKDEKKYTLNNNTSMEISFTYNKNRITTSDTLGLVFHGYRYYVLYDATKKCSYLYPTNAIENIEYKYKCK